MEQIQLTNIIWPILLTSAVISFLDYIIERKKTSKIIAIVLTVVSIISMVLIIPKSGNLIYLQLCLFMFSLAISLVILALKKRIDAFTIIGILLMIVMLILLLRGILI